MLKVYSAQKENFGLVELDVSEVTDESFDYFPINRELGKIRLNVKLNISQILSDKEYDDLFTV